LRLEARERLPDRLVAGGAGTTSSSPTPSLIGSAACCLPELWGNGDLMRALWTFIRLTMLPWVRAFGTAFESYSAPRAFANKIALHDLSNFLRALKFLATAYAMFFAANAVIVFSAKNYFKQFGVEHEVSFNDFATSLNVIAMFILFGLISFILFRILGERAVTLQLIWHYYSYIADSALIVTMTLFVGLILINCTVIWLMIRVIGVDDLEIYKFVDATAIFAFIVVFIAINLYGMAIVAGYVNASINIGRAKVFVVVLASYILSLTSLFFLVFSVDRFAGLAHYETSGLNSVQKILNTLQSLW
jgi:hypothetical protein